MFLTTYKTFLLPLHVKLCYKNAMSHSEKEELGNLFQKLLREVNKMDDPAYRKKLLNEAHEICQVLEEEKDDKDFDV